MQTNGLPNHCYQATNENPTDFDLDFKVKFNMDVSGRVNVAADSVDSNEKTSELLCDIQRTAASNMFSDSGYTENSTRRELQDRNKPPPPDGGSGGMGMGGGGGYSVTAGIALSGAPFFNALSAELQDPFYPEAGE